MGVDSPKTAIVLFPHFCNYEISVLMEVLALAEKPVTFIASSLASLRCEEGMQAVADEAFADCDVDACDSLVITGSYAEGLYHNFADAQLHALIRRFHAKKKLIAAISSGPMVLCKASIMGDTRFVAGVEREWFLSDPKMRLSAEQMRGLIDVKDMEAMAERGEAEIDYVLEDNILTAVGWKFREWALAFGRALGLDVWPCSFGKDLT